MRPGTVALLLGVSGALACSGAAENSDGDAAATQPDSAAGAITATFGPGVSLYRAGPPAEFHGDFNGDGKIDALLVEQRPALRVIYMSGYTEEAIVQHGVLKPGIAFLNKPFTSRALLEKLAQILRHSDSEPARKR